MSIQFPVSFEIQMCNSFKINLKLLKIVSLLLQKYPESSQ